MCCVQLKLDFSISFHGIHVVVCLSKDQKDQWGIPLLITSVGYDDNDDKMVKDFLEQGKAMMEACGVKEVNTYDNKQPPGLDIHEMGGCRMGSDPKTSMLNEWNQLHHCKKMERMYHRLQIFLMVIL